MKFLTRLLSVLCFAITFSVSAESLNENPIQTQEWKTYDSHEFSFSYPGIYTSVLLLSTNINVALIEQRTSETDQFSENITLIKQPIRSIEQYIAITLVEVKQANAIDFKYEKVNVNGLEGVCFSYVQKQKDYTLHYLQYALFGEKYIYLLTQATTDEEFESHKDDAIKTFNSFKLNPDVKTENNWSIFSNEYIFFTYPDRFQQIQSEEENSENMFTLTLREVSDDENDLYTEQYYLTITDLGEEEIILNDKTMKMFSKELTDSWKEDFNVQPLKSDKKNLLKYFMISKENKNLITYVHAYFENNLVYLILFSGEKEKYEKLYKEEAEKTFESIKILKPKK